MNSCSNCLIGKPTRGEKSQRSPKKRRYRNVSGRKRRISPMGCESCSREEQRSPRKPFTYCTACEPSSSPYRSRCCSPEHTEAGFINTIRSSIQKIFTARKPNQLYMYSMSQLKCIEKLLGKLENETCCIEDTIKRAVQCHCNIDCNKLKWSLNMISDRVEGVKCDLVSAQDCYDPCRDKCEFDLICCLMEKVYSLERRLQELHLHVECLEIPPPRDTCCATRGTCTSNNRKQCCGSCKGPVRAFSIDCPRSCRESHCKQKCHNSCGNICNKPISCGLNNYGKVRNNCSPKGLCRTSSVIPVGVMLVKL